MIRINKTKYALDAATDYWSGQINYCLIQTNLRHQKNVYWWNHRNKKKGALTVWHEKTASPLYDSRLLEGGINRGKSTPVGSLCS